ncbi:hypothetical protein JTB14_024970 [Gonioctena quinquepunctata]|nr:hypothetical protein JTB14_024970 [Gonioctena quinquepunctata]
MVNSQYLTLEFTIFETGGFTIFETGGFTIFETGGFTIFKTGELAIFKIIRFFVTMRHKKIFIRDATPSDDSLRYTAVNKSKIEHFEMVQRRVRVSPTLEAPCSLSMIFVVMYDNIMMEFAKEKRSEDFTNNDKSLSTNIVTKHESIIENRETDAVTSNEKNGAWEIIGQEFNSSGTRYVECSEMCYDNNKKLLRKSLEFKRREL